jgi:hypothetical protein
MPKLHLSRKIFRGLIAVALIAAGCSASKSYVGSKLPRRASIFRGGVTFPQISTILSNPRLPQTLSLGQLEPDRLNSLRHSNNDIVILDFKYCLCYSLSSFRLAEKGAPPFVRYLPIFTPHRAPVVVPLQPSTCQRVDVQTRRQSVPPIHLLR